MLQMHTAVNTNVIFSQILQGKKIKRNTLTLSLCVHAFTYMTHSHQMSLNLTQSRLTVLQAKAASGGLSGCFKILGTLNII